MFRLITGGSGSGKSSYAERQILQFVKERMLQSLGRNLSKNFPCLYIATMKPCGEETQKKIGRHRGLRAGKGFETIECYQGIDKITLPQNSGVLLECISNLAANEFYEEDGTLRDRQETAEKILDGVRHILNQTDHLVVVTNEVSSDVWNYSYETQEYTALIGTVNQQLACMADKVTEVVYGIPVPVKG